MIRGRFTAPLALALAAALGAAVAAEPQPKPQAPPQAAGAVDGEQMIRPGQAPSNTMKDAGTRPARPAEVRVRVLLLPEFVKNNPDEYVTVDGVRYIHFRSPRLASPAKPLTDPQLRYPLGELERKDGAVIVQLLIDEKGNLARSDVVCAARGFSRSATESVKGLKFQPAMAKDGPVKSFMHVEFGYGRGFPCIPAPYY
jgi:outer membrane biosynthesis protein TonB